MNKNKFLKKSLAAVLAILMVVAMIPLSAAAVEAPPVSKITVGGVEATGTGTAREVNLVESTSLPQVVVQLDANNGGNDGSVLHIEGDDNHASANTANKTALAAQWTFTLTADEYKDGGAVKFRVFHKNNVDFTDYTVTLHFVDGSADNSIKSIGFSNGDNQYGSTTQDENGVYIITAKYGTITPASDSLTVELGSDKATLTGTGVTVGAQDGAKWPLTAYTVGTVFNLQVKSQNGELANYQAKVVAPTFFKSISTPNEYKEVKVDESAKTIDLYIPFGTKVVTKDNGTTNFYEIPLNFEVGYPSATIKTVAAEYPNLSAGSEKEIKSGDNVYLNTTSAGTTGVTLIYTYNGVDTPFTLKATKTANDPAATISGVKVGNYVAKLEGTTFTLELPASFMAASGNNSTNLEVKASEGSTVTLAGIASPSNGSGQVTGDEDAFVTLTSAFDASKEATYTLRVVSGASIDGKTDAKDYTLVVKKVAIAEEAAMKAMVLENSDGKQFPAEINGNTIKFKLPYSTQVNDVKAPAPGKEWKLYYDVSSGAYVSSPALVVSGSTFDSGDTATVGIFPSAFDGKTVDGTAIEVVASDNSTKKYNVVVEKLPAATGHSIVKFGVTHDDANKLDDVDKNDIFEATPSGTNVIINVPFSKYGDFDKGSKVVPIFELSEGAKIYRVAKAANNIDNDLTKVAPLTGVTADAPGAAIATDGAHFDGTAVSSSDSTPKSLCLFVISEGATDPTVGGGFTSTWKQANAGKYTEYKLQVKKAAANKTVKLDQVKLFNNSTKEEVIGTVNNAAETITFNNIPNHFMTDATANNVYLDYKVSKGEGVVIDATSADNTGTFINPIVYGDNGKIKTIANESDKKVAAITTTPANTSGEATGDYGSLYIESEDGEVGNGTATQSRVYTIKYNVAPAEAGATLNSVTINGVTARPDADNKVTITLPMAAEVTSLKPAFDVSKYASVLNGGVSGAVITNGEDSFNFSSARTFTVKSENGANTNTYTVEVKVSKDFSDVKPGDWFYSYVMDAVDRGIIIGNGDGTFGPYTNVTRAQFATMMARVDGFDKNAEYTNPFSDMQGITGETLKAIAYCADKGYITGDGDTTFRPNDTISRQEMAVIISRVLKLDTENVTIGTRFADDAKIAGWAKNYVYACVNAKMLMGEGSNTFNPLGNTIRAAAATAAVRVDNAK